LVNNYYICSNVSTSEIREFTKVNEIKVEENKKLLLHDQYNFQLHTIMYFVIWKLFNQSHPLETYNGPFQHDTLGDKVLAKFWSCKKAVQCISFTKIVSQIFNI